MKLVSWHYVSHICIAVTEARVGFFPAHNTFSVLLLPIPKMQPTLSLPESDMGSRHPGNQLHPYVRLVNPWRPMMSMPVLHSDVEVSSASSDNPLASPLPPSPFPEQWNINNFFMRSHLIAYLLMATPPWLISTGPVSLPLFTSCAFMWCWWNFVFNEYSKYNTY